MNLSSDIFILTFVLDWPRLSHIICHKSIIGLDAATVKVRTAKQQSLLAHFQYLCIHWLAVSCQFLRSCYIKPYYAFVTFNV